MSSYWLREIDLSETTIEDLLTDHRIRTLIEFNMKILERDQYKTSLFKALRDIDDGGFSGEGGLGRAFGHTLFKYLLYIYDHQVFELAKILFSEDEGSLLFDKLKLFLQLTA